MSAIYEAEVSHVKVTQVSTPEEDKNNGGIPRWRISATIEFDGWGKSASEVREVALYKLKTALS